MRITNLHPEKQDALASAITQFIIRFIDSYRPDKDNDYDDYANQQFLFIIGDDDSQDLQVLFDSAQTIRPNTGERKEVAQLNTFLLETRYPVLIGKDLSALGPRHCDGFSVCKGPLNITPHYLLEKIKHFSIDLLYFRLNFHSIKRNLENNLFTLCLNPYRNAVKMTPAQRQLTAEFISSLNKLNLQNLLATCPFEEPPKSPKSNLSRLFQQKISETCPDVDLTSEKSNKMTQGK